MHNVVVSDALMYHKSFTTSEMREIPKDAKLAISLNRICAYGWYQTLWYIIKSIKTSETLETFRL